MVKIKLYSPPIITAKKRVRLGHGANLVWCDVLARTYAKDGISSEYHFPAWNHQGKMFDSLAESDCLEKTLNEIESSMESKTAFFGLDKYTAYKDTSKESRENARDKFQALIDRGFIVLDNDSYFLRIDRIEKEMGLASNIKSANFFPQGSKERLLNLIKTLNGAYPITKPREFATTVPGNESSIQKINPIFDLAVSPFLFSREPVDYSIDSLKTMLHGTFIPFVIWSGLYDIPFSKNVTIHGYLKTNLGLNDEDLENFSQKTNLDVIRGSALLCTDTMQDTDFNETRMKKILKGTSKLIKLAWFFKDFFCEGVSDKPYSPSLKDDVLNMRQSLAMDRLVNKIYSLSHQLEIGNLTEKDYSAYYSLLNDSQIFFPNTYNRAVKILKREAL